MENASLAQHYKAPEQRWSALVKRDAGADNMFVYGVRTTGVYCRASCHSRTPNRANVDFFDDAAAAELAGFRPCKRCRPDSPVAHPHLERVRNACRLIEGAETEPTLAQLANTAAMSPYHFQRVFRELVGLSPKQYAKAHRLGRLKELLPQSGTVTAAIYEAGFESASRGYDSLSRRLGMAPRNYQSGGARQNMHYGFTETSLGTMLVAATERGVCMIAFGDSQSMLVEQLHQRFAGASLSKAGSGFDALLAQAAQLAENPSSRSALPLDIHGTAFQERVWQALCKIPAGRTQTYSEVAEALGNPKAVRAVAKACGDNPVAVAVPCHRVIGRDGKLHGYRWGLQRKEMLLEKEARKKQ